MLYPANGSAVCVLHQQGYRRTDLCRSKARLSATKQQAHRCGYKRGVASVLRGTCAGIATKALQYLVCQLHAHK
jgi:hypothetical protein